MHRVRTTFCLRLFQWKAGTMRFLRGKPLLCGESKILAAMLKQLGIESIPAGSAKEALEQLKIRKPEMILTDLWMPEMNGTELAEHLAKSPDTAGIPVFAITADSQALGNLPETFSGILLKPVTLAALRKSLQEFPPTGK